MNKKFFSSLAVGLAFSSAALTAQAIPISYTLDNVKFADGTSATGSFIFDATTRLSSGFDISTYPGVLGAFNWTRANSGLYQGGGAGPNNFILMTTDGRRVFNFSFLNPLTNAGGTYAINIASTYECNNCGTFRRVISGNVTSNAVPEPATLALMLPALGALFVAARRRKQARA